MVESEPRAFRKRLERPTWIAITRDWVTPILPIYRLARRHIQYRSAQARCLLPELASQRPQKRIIHVIGAGRSGTTLLGALLATHIDTRYVFEPWHLWAVVNPLTDVHNFFTKTRGQAVLRGSSVDQGQVERFRRLFLAPGSEPLVIEKTPSNALRIEFLEALGNQATYIHIRRDGGEVASSIARIAERPPYPDGLRRVNQWWGVNGAKWTAVKATAEEFGYSQTEVDALDSDLQRGAFEWLISVIAVERMQVTLGDRLIELDYTDLVHDPIQTLQTIAEDAELTWNEDWGRSVAPSIGAASQHQGIDLAMPRRLADDFNRMQIQAGFPTKARTTDS